LGAILSALGIVLYVLAPNGIVVAAIVAGLAGTVLVVIWVTLELLEKPSLWRPIAIMLGMILAVALILNARSSYAARRERLIREQTCGSELYLPDVACLPNDDTLGFVAIPAGDFSMGSSLVRDPLAQNDELEVHTVTLGPYAIGRYEITVGQYLACVFAHYCGLVDQSILKQPKIWPIANISWREALAYCDWLENTLNASSPAKIGWRISLPTEAEWERAARGQRANVYPWGDRFDPSRGAFNGRQEPAVVGSFSSGMSPDGLFDMSGNVAEWTLSQYQSYPYKPNDGREVTEDSMHERVTRGGGFEMGAGGVRAAVRGHYLPGYRDRDTGFRIVARTHPLTVPWR
jgi:formylglycine-generating enzyme required for sulfatase activity